ncbi:hypothetical protein CCHOA_06830 [Corynebacterium choanae]|uniref:Uncharacterized protein n=1 Tax=Corynebacterium choanae TaxID=1862358 RepID=A0A3G6JA32_9CORY|nr:hypothetical protein CCHOA_06830 [Corynebacterium choanae]
MLVISFVGKIEEKYHLCCVLRHNCLANFGEVSTNISNAFNRESNLRGDALPKERISPLFHSGAASAVQRRLDWVGEYSHQYLPVSSIESRAATIVNLILQARP